MTPPSPWLTVAQVVAALHVHPEVVRRWLRQGRLRGIKMGRAWRVSSAALPQPPGPLLNVLEGRVRRVDTAAGLAWVHTGGETLAVKAAGMRRGEILRVHLGAEAILVAQRPLRGVSARNQWRGKVAALLVRGDGVEVHVATTPPLVAWMTPDAVRDLGLEPGKPVVLVFKAGACRAHSLGAAGRPRQRRPAPRRRR